MPLDQVDVDKLGPGKGNGNSEMSFLDHLEELRWHIIRSLVAIVAVGTTLFIFKDWFFDTIIFGPTHDDFLSYRLICDLSNAIGLQDAMCFSPPQFRKIAVGFGEAFITSIKVSFVAGFILAFPYVFFEFWRFISPGLYSNERKATRGIVFICSMLFLMGVLFGYFIISPFAVNFLVGYTIPGVENSPTLNSFINYMIMFTAPAGLIFELPIVVYFLAKVGLVTPQGMRQYRRHAIIVTLLLAALITPPDVVTQFLIGIPLFILYELSITIAARTYKKYQEELNS
jgi:sec-independent protein translocase protein TatC